MKTRIIQTRYWDDDCVVESYKLTKYLYIYILTSQYINISGMFQLHDKKILAETDLTPTELKNAQNELTKRGKVFFHEGWVYVVNAMKNNNYVKSEDNKVAYQKELSKVPPHILNEFNSSVDSSVESTPKSTNKQEIRNNKSEKKGECEGETQKLLEAFNEIYQTNYKSTKSWAKNFAYWRAIYSLDEIIEAVRKAKNHSFYKDKLNPDMLLRAHEDRIGQLLNNRKESLIL